MFTSDVVIVPAAAAAHCRRPAGHPTCADPKGFAVHPCSGCHRQPTPIPAAMLACRKLLLKQRLGKQLSAPSECGAPHSVKPLDDANADASRHSADSDSDSDALAVVCIKQQQQQQQQQQQPQQRARGRPQTAASAPGRLPGYQPTAFAVVLAQLARSSPFAAPEVQACTCHHRRASCTQHGVGGSAARTSRAGNAGGPSSGSGSSSRSRSKAQAQQLKQKLKAAVKFFSEGMAFARVCVAAPVPACPSADAAAARARH